jgi:tRNA dimethylallyltransferase
MAQRDSWPPVIVIVGPTAAGKSQLALQLAQAFNADIVSADSRQIYRYMDIGTAKPSRHEQEAVTHYMLDLVEPSDAYSAKRYGDEGRRALKKIAFERRVAFVVGGTGFYLRMLLEGLSVPPVPPDDQLRERLRREASEKGVGELHRRLQSLDPASAHRIHENNLPRIIRALEIVEVMGSPVPRTAAAERVPAYYIGLAVERDRLREIIDARVHNQVQSGLVEETEMLLSMGYSPSSPALAGFGYRQMVDYLMDRSSLDTAITEYQKATRHYARRQMTWFRQNRDITWIQDGASLFSHARELTRRWLTAVP